VVSYDYPRGYCQVIEWNFFDLIRIDICLPSGRFLDTRHLIPDIKYPIAEQSIMSGFQKVTADTEQVVDGALGGKKSLRIAG